MADRELVNPNISRRRFFRAGVIAAAVGPMFDVATAHGSESAQALPEHVSSARPAGAVPGQSFQDAAAFGFSPEATGSDNAKALQRAVDQGGTVVVSRPGIYAIADTVYVGSNTTLIFGNDVFLKKVKEQGGFSQVLLNKGALTRTYDHNIVIEGLQIIVNGVDDQKVHILGLRGQLAFFYIKDLRVERFRCLDLGKWQYAIHICTFENIIVHDVIIKGSKDGVHLGRGKRFTISNGIFQTGDDAVALNGQDYSTSNPEQGWIEEGVVENCHDLADLSQHAGFFCRILAGAWIDWKPGMEVQQSDTVVSDGRLYRVHAEPNGRVFKSLTQPTFASGSRMLDGIPWAMAQTDLTYTAGVRNVVFRDIFLEKPRPAVSIHFDDGKYSRSYYPGAQIPIQRQFVFDNVRVFHNQDVSFLLINTPVDVVTLKACSLRNGGIRFTGVTAMTDYLKTWINMLGCIFNCPGEMDLVVNENANKAIAIKTTASVELSDNFSAKVISGGGAAVVDSDLTGLKK